MNFQIKEKWYGSMDDMDGDDHVFDNDHVFAVAAISIKSQMKLKGMKLSAQLT
jgi:hypothetical protein